MVLIIDKSFRTRVLPSGTPCYSSSAVYFDKNVYCFGGRYNVMSSAPLSERFDLDKNRWIKLTPMPKADFHCSSIAFNGNILISGFFNRNLLLYSIDMDSFSTISYDFTENKQKLLLNAWRLYLIEFRGGMVYESEAGNEYSWERVADSIIRGHDPGQICWSYNKCGIYIGEEYFDGRSSHFKYFRFDLISKAMKKIVRKL
ncbi:unnamed protein product [Blepharisma stoltei]|uniref:Uncharacterized protein n=1 Tax=Blepharisma stoltei TaxID=1481888 RepID=A0AAU9KEZ5_9CILI|nr:unnamed protein product [Blepharisma stoltei]